MGNSSGSRCHQSDGAVEAGQPGEATYGAAPVPTCGDGKDAARRTQHIFPLAHGVSGRVGPCGATAMQSSRKSPRSSSVPISTQSEDLSRVRGHPLVSSENSTRKLLAIAETPAIVHAMTPTDDDLTRRRRCGQHCTPVQEREIAHYLRQGATNPEAADTSSVAVAPSPASGRVTFPPHHHQPRQRYPMSIETEIASLTTKPSAT